MSWPLVLHLRSDVGANVGDPPFVVWQLAWIGHALLHQPLHLFQANMSWPLADSLAFSDAPVGYAPMGLVAQLGPHAALAVYNLLFLFAYVLAFVGGYMLARELGAEWFGAAIAGAAFAYAPWRLGQNGHLGVISSGGIPLAVFLLVHGYRRRNGWFVLAGWLFAGWQMTLGFTLGLPLAYLLAVLAVLAARPFVRRPRPLVGWRLVYASALGVYVFASLTVLQALPYLRVIHAHHEATRSRAQIASFSPPPVGFFAAPHESLVWSGVTAGIRNGAGLVSEQTLFPGVTIVALALAGLFGATYSRRLRLGLGLGVLVCAVFSLGLSNPLGLSSYMPYRLLYEFAPGWNGVRTPGRINTLTSLGLALLAAAGASVAWQGLRSTRGRWLRDHGPLALGAALTGAILLEGLGPLTHPAVPQASPVIRHAAVPQLQLPLEFDDASLYSYWSIAGFPDTANSYGAFEPESVAKLETDLARFPDPPSVALLRKLGIRTVILHPNLAGGTPWQNAARKPVAGLGVVRTAAHNVVLYRITPLA
jgi:MFS family permease